MYDTLLDEVRSARGTICCACEEEPAKWFRPNAAPIDRDLDPDREPIDIDTPTAGVIGIPDDHLPMFVCTGCFLALPGRQQKLYSENKRRA